MDCLFCKIAGGEIPSEIVYEDERTIGFKDISPVAPNHILFITKAHYANINELSENPKDLTALFEAIRKYTLQEGLSEDGFRIVSNLGVRAQQSVPHVHIHVIGGRDLQWPPG